MNTDVLFPNPVAWTMQVGPHTIGDGSRTIIAGPCLAESYEICIEVGRTMKEICEELGMQYIFKASFDKANRTSSSSSRGPGVEEGVQILEAVRQELQVPVTTDIHLPEHPEMLKGRVDLLQIPAFLCRQTDLLIAAADSGMPVNVKKGQFLAPQDTQNIVEKMKQGGAKSLMLTERGTSFGYNTLIVDFPGLQIMRSFGVPVCMDATHSAQRPGGMGKSSGGNRDAIPALLLAAVSVGVDAVFMEVHPEPEKALSDAATQWPLSQARILLEKAKKHWNALAV